ncbi:MAG: FtsX-like permease family protein [Candidatus Paceibacterota bacterium]|jgi:putative ABC transport system permease protein
MKPKDLIYVTFQNFKNRKSRVFFTVLGVAVAIAVVLSLVSFGYGLQKNLLEQITTEQALLSLDIYPSDSEIIKIDKASLEKISQIKNIEKVVPEATFSGQMSLNGTISEANINVTLPDFFALDGKSPSTGRFFTDKDTKKVVVSSIVPELFNIKPDEIIGKKMVFTAYYTKEKGTALVEQIPLDNDFEIIGIVESKGNTAEAYFNKKDFPDIPVESYSLAKIKVKDSYSLDAVRVSLINMGFTVSSISDIVDQANKIFSIVQLTLGIFGVFALIVAAIGLVNTMTISLLERTNEIGVMRAIGAAPEDIKKIFLGESIIIGFLGGVFGILLGILVSEMLNWGFGILATYLGGVSVSLFSYPFWFIIFILIVSTIVGFAGGLWPAHRAASMNPLQALKYK